MLRPHELSTTGKDKAWVVEGATHTLAPTLPLSMQNIPATPTPETKPAHQKTRLTLDVHHPSGAYRCPCGKGVNSLRDLFRHALANHPRATFTCTCDICSYTSHSIHGLLCHIPRCERESGDAAPVLHLHQCTICHNRFNTARGLSQHLKSRHPDAWNRIRIEKLKQIRTLGPGRGSSGATWTASETKKLIA